MEIQFVMRLERGGAVLKRVKGFLNAPLHSPLWKNARGGGGFLKKIHPPGCRGDGEAWRVGMRRVGAQQQNHQRAFISAHFAAKSAARMARWDSLNPPLHFLPHNGGNVLSKLSRVANLYISRSCKHLRRSAFLQTRSGFT